jgi:cation transport ATPase
VEPLRAPAVLLYEDGPRYLCSAACREDYRDGARQTPPPAEAKTAAPPRRPAPARPVIAPVPLPEPLTPPVPVPGLAASVFAAFFALLTPFSGIFVLLALVAVGTAAALAGLRYRALHDRLGVWLAGPVGAALAALSALFVDEPRGLLLGAAVAAAAVVGRAWLAERAHAPVRAATWRLRTFLPGRAYLVGEAGPVPVAADEVRAGQDVTVDEGERAPVDGVVRSGEAQVLLHPGSHAPSRRGPGDPVLAGARVLEGSLRVLPTQVGPHRALLRPPSFADPPITAPPLLRLPAQTLRIGVLGGLAFVLGALLWHGDLASQLGAVAALLLAAPLTAVRGAVGPPMVAASAAALERGIHFDGPEVLERAGRTQQAALCSHGTVTEGQPEVIEVRSLDESNTDALLAAVAGAELSAEGHPIARALVAHVRDRGLAPDSVRRAVHLPGRGVTAVAPNGEELVFGNRQLLLQEGVSVAVADEAAAEGEARGDTVLLAALDGRVRAVLRLRDEERVGARAAIQRLIDLSIEVLLLSGDHRATVEAMAATLDVGHVKAELLPEERAQEVRRLREAGGVVAVIGRRRRDEPALEAADVAVILGAAGAAEARGAIALTGEDVRDATTALWLARATRREATRSLAIVGLAGAGALVLSLVGVVPAWLAALLGLLFDGVALPSAERLLQRIELRMPRRG